MKTNIKIILFSICIIVLTFTSCTKEPGCMDPNSMTYNSEAQKDDGSCIYAYDIAQGIWNITPNCEEIDILGQTISLNDQLPESIEVQGAGDNSLFIDIDGTQVSGEIDNMGNITVNPQTVQIDPGIGTTLDVDVEGSGFVTLDNIGEMELTYSFNLPPPLDLLGSQSISCDIDLYK